MSCPTDIASRPPFCSYMAFSTRDETWRISYSAGIGGNRSSVSPLCYFCAAPFKLKYIKRKSFLVFAYNVWTNKETQCIENDLFWDSFRSSYIFFWRYRWRSSLSNVRSEKKTGVIYLGLKFPEGKIYLIILKLTPTFVAVTTAKEGTTGLTSALRPFEDFYTFRYPFKAFEEDWAGGAEKYPCKTKTRKSGSYNRQHMSETVAAIGDSKTY